jgi:hypothetical protein
MVEDARADHSEIGNDTKSYVDNCNNNALKFQ